MNERSVGRAFESLVPVEVAAPIASCAFGMTLLAIGLMLEDPPGSGELAVFAPPAIACAVAIALFARGRTGWGALVLIACGVLQAALACASHDPWSLIVVPIATLLMIALQVPLMFAARSTASLRAVDRGDTFMMWSALWSGLVFIFLFNVFGRDSTAAHACLFCCFVCASGAVMVLRRAIVRRDLSRLARTGRLPGFRVRKDLGPDEAGRLRPLYGSDDHWEFAVLERFDGPVRAPVPPQVDAYRGPQPGPIAGVPALPGAPLGLIPT